MADENSRGGKSWLWLLLGGGFLAWAWQAHSADATTGTVTPAATSPTDQITQMTNWVHNLLTQYGYKTVPAYVTPTSATEEIVDTTGANRILSQRNQSITDNFHAFMWNVNAAMVFKTVDPATILPQIQSEYAALQQGLTPAFLT
jgi:hypothetical protein